MDFSAENAAALAELRRRCQAARTTPRKLCERARVGYTTFLRGEKAPGSLTVEPLRKLEDAMASIEGERAA